MTDDAKKCERFYDNMRKMIQRSAGDVTTICERWCKEMIQRDDIKSFGKKFEKMRKMIQWDTRENIMRGERWYEKFLDMTKPNYERFHKKARYMIRGYAKKCELW